MVTLCLMLRAPQFYPDPGYPAPGTWPDAHGLLLRFAGWGNGYDFGDLALRRDAEQFSRVRVGHENVSVGLERQPHGSNQRLALHDRLHLAVRAHAPNGFCIGVAHDVAGLIDK